MVWLCVIGVEVGGPVVCAVVALWIVKRPRYRSGIARGCLVAFLVLGIALSLYLAFAGLIGMLYTSMVFVVGVILGILCMIACIAGITRLVRGVAAQSDGIPASGGSERREREEVE